METLKDEECQIHGMCCVVYLLEEKDITKNLHVIGHGYSPDNVYNKELICKEKALYNESRVLFVEDVPLRMICHLNYTSMNVQIFFLSSLSRAFEHLVNFKVHHGPYMETQYQLMTYGIPAATIPINAEGIVDLTNHMEWVKSLYLQYNNITEIKGLEALYNLQFLAL